MKIDVYKFADALAAWMAAEASPSLKYADDQTPRQLWLGQAVEGDACAPVYTILTAYAAALQPIGLPVASVQLRTAGEDGAANEQAVKLFNLLIDPEDGRPVRQQLLNEQIKVIAFTNLRPPALVTRDTTTRQVTVASNFDVEYVVVA